jgi:hypothetical protein
MYGEKDEKLCKQCRVGAHDHCACQCEVCAHRFDQEAKSIGAEQRTDAIVAFALEKLGTQVADAIDSRFPKKRFLHE